MSNLLKEILERVEYERLIEEGKDPVEVLHYKFQHIPSEIIDDVIAIDPTKKKSYSQWLLSKWDDEKDTIVNGLKSGRIAKLFQHYKEHNDIQIKDCPSVEEGLRMFVPEEDTVLTKSDKPKTYIENLGTEVDSSLANDFDIVYNDGDWIIAVPNTYEAECKLGENMRWCTANHFGNGESYYNNYLSEGGKYYVNFDMTKPENAKGKDYPFTRYQFHFESNQFMDKDDNPVELDSIGIPDGAKEYYSDEGYDTDEFENLEARMDRYNEQRWGCSWRINDDLLLNIAYDDDFQFQEPDGNGTDSPCHERQAAITEESSRGNRGFTGFPSVQPTICRGDDGLPFDVDDLATSEGKWRKESIKAYGNAWVPQVALEIFKAIEEYNNN